MGKGSSYSSGKQNVRAASLKYVLDFKVFCTPAVRAGIQFVDSGLFPVL